MSTSLDELRSEDLAEAAALIYRESGAGQQIPPGAHAHETSRLRWLLEDNPARQPDIPFGWVVRDTTHNNKIVGVKTCIPQRFRCRDQSFIACMSAKFYVNEAHRGAGLGLFLKFLKLGKKYPLFCTTAGLQSGALWEKFNAYAIPNQDHEVIGIMRYASLVEEVIQHRLKKPALSKLAGTLARFAPNARGLNALCRRARREGASLTRLNSADELAALQLPESLDVLSADRSPATLRWRHFSTPDQGLRHIYAFNINNHPPTLVITQPLTRGYRHQVRALHVMDIYPPLPPDQLPLLAGTLANHYAGSFDMLVFRGLDSTSQTELTDIGFRRRTFPATVAWCIDRENILPTRDWYVVHADSE